ncbi:hypothetical protein TYRP_000976, partial [Tyrophagus putrescentiae]
MGERTQNLFFPFLCLSMRYDKRASMKRRSGNENKKEMKRENVERIAVNEDTKVNFDPSGKSVVFKVEDAPVRVLNKLAALGYTVLPSAGGGSSSGHGHDKHN